MKMSMSLDGFVAGPNGEIDWVFRSSDPESQAWTVDVLSRAGLHAMGRRTWNDMTAFWPYATSAFAAPMNTVPKVVFTRQLALTPGDVTAALTDARADDRVQQPADPDVLRGWRHPRVAAGDLVQSVRLLKAESGGDVLAHGGSSFMRSLVEHDLVDEYYLAIHPVVLGRGQAIFSTARARDLELVDSRRFAKGVVTHTYRRTRG